MSSLSDKRNAHHIKQLTYGKSIVKKEVTELDATIADGSYAETVILDLLNSQGILEVVGTTDALHPHPLLYEVRVSQDKINFFNAHHLITQSGNTLGLSWTTAFRYCQIKVTNSTGSDKQVHLLFSSL